MAKKMSKLEAAQQKAEEKVKLTNERIEELGSHTCKLYEALTEIQKLFDIIRNVPADTKLQFEKLRSISLNWKQQAEKIEADYNKAEVKVAGHGAAGIGAGVAVAALGPMVAMGIATTFGVASTGTAISALSGAAATNAALAWLGGGALVAGGGGMAAGNALLALAGPVGLTIAGASLIFSGVMIFVTKMNKEKLENIFTLISERDVRSYETAIAELNERIQRIKTEIKKLTDAIERIKTFSTDYNAMSESQQYELGSYYNLMEASTMLLINPILGLQPKFSEQDFEKLCSSVDKLSRKYYTIHKAMVISLANLLFKIDIDDDGMNLLAKSLKNNKEFLSSVGITKQDFGSDDILMVEKALKFRYGLRAY